MTRKTKLIINPQSNMGDTSKIIAEIKKVMSKYENADVSVTAYRLHATELAKQAALDGYELVIAAGGDGTAHEVINGLMQVPQDKRPLFGVVPVGSGNDLAFVLNQLTKPQESITRIMKSETSTSIDIGLYSDDTGHKEYFDNTVGIGFDAVVGIRSHRIPLLRGFVMYLVAVIQTILLNHDLLKMQIETDGVKWERTNLLVAVCNGAREGGGFFMAPEAKNNDGVFHYTMIEECSRLMMFRLLPEVMKGTHGNFKQVKIDTCKTMSLNSNLPLYIHLDGETIADFGSNVKTVRFEMLPAALKVVV